MTFHHSSKWRRDATVKDLSDYGKQLLSAIGGVRSTNEVSQSATTDCRWIAYCNNDTDSRPAVVADWPQLWRLVD